MATASHLELLADTLFGTARALSLEERAKLAPVLAQEPPSSLRRRPCWFDFNKEAILDSAPENPIYTECVTLANLALQGRLVIT